MNNRWGKTSLEKYVPLTYCKGLKRVTQGFTVRGSWRPNRTAIYWPPLLWPSALCLSRSPGLLNRRPRGPALCWMMAFFTASYQQFLWTPTHWLPVFTKLYNSSMPTHSPTQSLEWHVWSSSSGNNCHAFQRSLSSGASVYECIMGFLPCPISSAKSAYAISLDYWPLECFTSFRHITLKWHVWPGQRSKYNTFIAITPWSTDPGAIYGLNISV